MRSRNKIKFLLERYNKNNGDINIEYINEIDDIENIIQNLIDISSNKESFRPGIYKIFMKDKCFLEKVSKNEINLKKYEYHIATEKFFEFLKEMYLPRDEIRIWWYSRDAEINSGDCLIFGEEYLKNIKLNQFCNLLGEDPKTYPIFGVSRILEEKFKDIVQNFVNHKLNFRKYCYYLGIELKGTGSPEWDKWLPIL